MKSYPPFIAGRDVQPEGWVYSLRASALFDDMFGALRCKRELESGRVAFEPVDPRVTGRVGTTSVAQGEAALLAASAAQRHWAAVPLDVRYAFGLAVHREMARRADELVEILIGEGHPRRLAEWEVSGILGGSSEETLRSNVHELERERSVDQRTLRLVRKPDGVVCLNPPQNAATSVSVLGLGALIAGNSLVVKIPRTVPLGVSFIYRDIVAPILEEFDAPPGVLNLVCSPSEAVLQQWLESPLVDDIFFVGSSERGLKLGAECAVRGKKPILELAGNDGILVWKDADLPMAARALAECFYGSTQICMVPKYAVVHPDVAGELLALLVGLLGDIRPGYPEDPDTVLTPVLKSHEFFTVLQQAVSDGAELITGGDRMDHTGAPSPTGVFIEPTVLRVDGLDAADRVPAVREETFFPLLPVVVPTETEAADVDKVLAFIDANSYGLRNSLWTQDQHLIARFCSQVNNGGLLKINDSHVGFAPGLPTHGGTGLTGGPFGQANFPVLMATHLQGISIATEVQPRAAVFDTGFSQWAKASGESPIVPWHVPLGI
ncbi:aldehyde dehydrogenase family protein [Streptomyces sp. NPDC059917]|uniref:aldehyde dehydrogenase family protein n=1 Tax=Streptomyces sp. NPDC059917 TaxID=3347002 RepID=UPI0036658AB7